jgi:uncharacterized protein DUF4384
MQDRRQQLGILVGSALLSILAAGQQTQPDASFNARDMFYSAADMLGAKKAATKTRTSASTKRSQGKTTSPTEPAAEVSGLQSIPQDPEAHFQRISVQSNLALGLRYSILKKTDSALIEVKPDSLFHSGDRIRISVMGNQKGYLYVISRGSSGVWTPLFPHPESSARQNEIVPGRKYQIPAGDREFFLFDQQAGAEKLFMLLARTPVNDLDALISSLSPASPPPPAQETKVIEARNRLNDELVDRLRTEIQARDLVFTRTDTEPAAAGDTGETAVYVVNQNSAGRTDSRVVVDLTLNHQ